jgi:uncharacterized protein
MKFALNYSPIACELIDSGLIEVDLLKLPDWEDLVAEISAQYPVYVHFSNKAGQGSPTSQEIRAMQHLRQHTGTKYVNTHLLPRYEDVSRPDDPQCVIDTTKRDIIPLIDFFGAENVIIENIPFPESTRDKPILAIDPRVMRAVVEDLNIGFLLDIGHARRTAEHLATDPRGYISQLPVERLKEVHITGLGYYNDGHRTDHMPMREDDWELFQWVLDQIACGAFGKPDIIACEYGGIGEHFAWRTDRDVIKREAPRMLMMIREASEKLLP